MLACALAGMALGLSACHPAAKASAPASGVATGLPSAAGTRDEALWREFDRIERDARAKPWEHLAMLAQLEPRTRPGSPERLELLSLRGLLGSLAPDRMTVDQATADLEAWPDAKTAQIAKTVAVAAQARLQRERGDLREAHRLLEAVPAQLLAQLPLAMQWRHQIVATIVEADVGNMDNAIVANHAALKIAENMDSGWRRTNSLSLLATTYYRSQQLDRAKVTADEGRTAAAADPDSDLMTLSQMERSIGIAHSEDVDTGLARRAFEAAIEYDKQDKATGLIALDLGNYADYHLRRGHYALALQLTEEALPLARQAHDRNAEGGALNNGGLAKIMLKRIDEGKADVMNAITLDEQQGAVSYAADGWNDLGTYLERAGDWVGAAAADDRYRELNDKIMREESRQAMLDTQERYDAEQRTKDIELLNRDNSLKAEQLRTRELQLRLWGAVGGCVVLAAALVALAYQRVRKTNAALATSNERLKLQSEHDPLTGLANRRHFQAAVKRLAERGHFNGTVFLVDIDHFKRINDQWGHAAGDSVLIEVARRLRSTLRESDLIVRWGGEEFLIVVESRDAAQVQHLAQRLLNQIAMPRVQHGDHAIPVTASIGFGSFPIEPNNLHVSWERAIDLVDTVMYIAKAHGRNKAYGVEHVDAHSEADLASLSTRMEAAWRDGRVGLLALQGPVAESRL